MRSLHDEYAKLQAQDPIHIAEATGGPRYCVHRYDDVASALKNQRFGGAPMPPKTLRLLRWIGLSALAHAAQSGFYASLNAPDHTRIRKVMDPTFTPRAVQARAARIDAIVAAMLDRLTGRAEFDLVADFAAPLPAHIIADVFGFPGDEVEEVTRWTDALLPMVDPDIRQGALLQSLRAFYKFRRRVLDLTADRALAPQDDLLTALAQAQQDGTLTRDEMVGSAALTLTAGHVTTRHLLTNAVRVLLDHPAVLERARQDPAAIDHVVEEVIRLNTPIQTTGRVTTDTVELAGQTIPEGAKIRLFLGAANHDPARFDCPAHFDIDRPDNRHLGFGGGIHQCIGIHLARVEVRIALGALFRRFPNLSAIENGVDWGPSRKFPGVERFMVRSA